MWCDMYCNIFKGDFNDLSSYFIDNRIDVMQKNFHESDTPDLE